MLVFDEHDHIGCGFTIVDVLGALPFCCLLSADGQGR